MIFWRSSRCVALCPRRQRQECCGLRGDPRRRGWLRHLRWLQCQGDRFWDHFTRRLRVFLWRTPDAIRSKANIKVPPFKRVPRMGRRAPRQSPYLWFPGKGYDQDALSRLQRAFPRPDKAMGGAFVMSGDRRTFDDLLGDLTSLSAEDLRKPLEEIASGTASFGPLDEWTDWYHCLLAQLIPRSHETHFEALLEILITGFITQHPDGPRNEPYPGFFVDALDTLGRCLMDEGCWPDGDIDVGACLNPRYLGKPWRRSGARNL